MKDGGPPKIHGPGGRETGTKYELVTSDTWFWTACFGAQNRTLVCNTNNVFTLLTIWFNSKVNI